jgi:hypothetical protein
MTEWVELLIHLRYGKKAECIFYFLFVALKSKKYSPYKKVVCGSGFDPDSMRSLLPDSQSRSGSRRAKMIHKTRKS